MRYKFYTLLAILVISGSVKAQEKWNLLKCVEYAMTNNISVKQLELQSKTSELQYEQSKLGQIPSLNLTGGPGFYSGRNQDPTTFRLSTESYISGNLQLQSSADIFNFFSKRNTIAANEWEYEAAKANTDKLKNDIALTVANAYLQILLAKEQENIAAVQLQQSQSQLSNTRKLVDAGALPELNAAELEAQVARDSATVISAKGTIEQNILNLKAYMAIDAAAPFEVETPPVEKIPVEKIADLQPDAVYALAMANMPQQKANDFKIKAAEKFAAAAKGYLYPTISAYGSLGSTYATYFNQPSFAVKSDAFFTQLNENFRQTIGLSLSVPIFNGYNARTNYEKSKINTQNQRLQKQLDDQTLKQDIYRAYNAAVVALEKYNAGKKTVETAERSYGFAHKRYEVGMMSTFELITSQNNLFRAKLETVLNQFDYVFKMKVLEFYRGQGIKL